MMDTRPKIPCNCCKETGLLRNAMYPTKATRLGTLAHLEIELDSVEGSMDRARGRQEYNDLTTRRAELLGQIKELEREEI